MRFHRWGIGLCCACIGVIGLVTTAGWAASSAAIAAAGAACAMAMARRMRWTTVLGAAMGACAAIAALHLERWPVSSPLLPLGQLHAIGTIAEPSIPRGWHRRYAVDARELIIDGVRMPWQGRIVLREQSLQPAVAQGSQVTVRLRALPPQCWMGSPGDPPSADGEIVAAAPGTGLAAMLGDARLAVEQRIQRLLPEPHAGLLTGLLTGGQGRLPEETREDFSITGLAHITAVSGTNITLLLILLQQMLWWTPRGVRLVIALAAVLAFSVFVGGSASVVRATAMGIIGLLALHHGRQVHARSALLWTLTGMILWDPSALRDDLGLQLSFLATAGLLESGPLLAPATNKLPEALGLREAIHATLAAQLWAAPWSASVFGLVPAVGTIANILVAPLVPLAMFFGAASLPLSLISMTLGRVAAYIAWLPLEGILQSASHLAAAPGAAIAWKPGNVPLIAWYTLLMLPSLRGMVTSDTAAPSSDVCPALSTPAPASGPESEMHGSPRACRGGAPGRACAPTAA